MHFKISSTFHSVIRTYGFRVSFKYPLNWLCRPSFRDESSRAKNRRDEREQKDGDCEQRNKLEKNFN